MDERWIAAKPDERVTALGNRWVDLAQPRLGSEVLYATDDFFGPKERLIDPDTPLFWPDRFDDHGKWMDGWESRRKRGPGYDYCIVRLGCPGRIAAIDIDTSFFVGNAPQSASIDAANCGDGEPGDDDWKELIHQMPLVGDAHNVATVSSQEVWSHLRLNIFPDGGVARLRVFGRIVKDWSAHDPKEGIDLAALENGGKVVAFSDAHFGRPSNMLAPGKGRNMGDGWETARRRGGGHDWAIVRLATRARISRIIVDTAFFKGNYPDRVSVQAGEAKSDTDASELERVSEAWPFILPEQKLEADREHVFTGELKAKTPVSHVRVNIYPDGGISRLRVFGHIEAK